MFEKIVSPETATTSFPALFKISEKTKMLYSEELLFKMIEDCSMVYLL